MILRFCRESVVLTEYQVSFFVTMMIEYGWRIRVADVPYVK